LFLSSQHSFFIIGTYPLYAAAEQVPDDLSSRTTSRLRKFFNQQINNRLNAGKKKGSEHARECGVSANTQAD